VYKVEGGGKFSVLCGSHDGDNNDNEDNDDSHTDDDAHLARKESVSLK